jgi:hypothetical protein
MRRGSERPVLNYVKKVIYEHAPPISRLHGDVMYGEKVI